MADKARVRIFVDFWNFQLNWNEYHVAAGSGRVVCIPWKELPSVLVSEIAKGQSFKFAGAQVYASIDPANTKDKRLNQWLHHTLASYTGYSVDVRERKSRSRLDAEKKRAKLSWTRVQVAEIP